MRRFYCNQHYHQSAPFYNMHKLVGNWHININIFGLKFKILWDIQCILYTNTKGFDKTSNLKCLYSLYFHSIPILKGRRNTRVLAFIRKVLNLRTDCDKKIEMFCHHFEYRNIYISHGQIQQFYHHNDTICTICTHCIVAQYEDTNDSVHVSDLFQMQLAITFSEYNYWGLTVKQKTVMYWSF